MKYLRFVPVFRKTAAVSVMVLRAAQAPFATVVWWLEAMAPRLELSMINGEDDHD